MKQFTSEEEAVRILQAADFGTLSLVTPQGEPYGVPVNHVYLPEERCLVFHCARKGKKLDCISAQPKVSFSAVSHAQLVSERYTTHYDCAVATGTASIVTDDAERRRMLHCLCSRFSPGLPDEEQETERFFQAVCIVKIYLDSICGKRNLDG